MHELAFEFCDQHWLMGKRTILMGIVNVTPDSFSDGGSFLSPERAIEHGRQLVEQGAGILDVGGESSRPGADPVSAAEELRRTIPVIEGVASTGVPISIDTTKADVAREAIAAGATIVNDISGLQREPEMMDVLAETGAGCVVMHMRGTAETMQQFTAYTDIVSDLCAFFRAILATAATAGVPPERFMIDPGIGFSKTAEQNLDLIAATAKFRELGRPVLLGPSRKSFIGKLLPGTEPRDRAWGTAGAVAAGVLLGADVMRVHDVDEMRQVAAVVDAIRDRLGVQ